MGDYVKGARYNPDNKNSANPWEIKIIRTFEDSLPYRVSMEIQKHNYQISDQNGERREALGRDDFGTGIIKPNPRGLAGLFLETILGKERKPGLHIGTLYTAGAKGTTETKWLLEIYEKKYIPELAKLMRNVAAPYNAEVEVSVLEQMAAKEKIPPKPLLADRGWV